MSYGAPFIADSFTSRAAALAISNDLSRLEGLVLTVLRARKDGATDEQMQFILDMNPNTQRPRRVALVAKGLVRDSGRKMKTDAGRLATVWEAS